MASVTIIPFVPGHRPTDEARSAGLGSSDQVAFVNAGPDNRCLLLLELEGEGEVEVTTVTGREIRRRPVDAASRSATTGRPCSRSTPTRTSPATTPGQPLLADRRGHGAPRRRARDHDARRVRPRRSSARCTSASSSASSSRTREHQAPGCSHTVHPWFPVLLIGSHKAELYTRALVGDVVHKRQNLADPGWLMRVGLYLELMTAPRRGRGGQGRPRRSADAGGARRGRQLGRPDDQRRRAGGDVWALRRITQPIGRAPAARSAAQRSSSCTSTTRTSSTRSRSPGRTAPTPRRRGTGCSGTPSVPCCARRRTRFPELRPLPARAAAVRCSGTAAGTSGSSARCACPGRCRACSATRTGCSRRRAASTGRR